VHFSGLLNRVFEPTSTGLDKRVHRTLLLASKTLCECKHLSIAGLGRHLSSKVAVKHVIKRMDRLFGNRRLHAQRGQAYQVMVRWLVGRTPRPVILVDWSGLTRCGEYHFLRASVPVGGRALVLWESTYPEKMYSSRQAHREFVEMLKTLLPDRCRPIIVTDAGFRNPWFRLIKEQGWDFVGRVRNATYCRAGEDDEWVAAKSLYTKATRTARYLFTGLLARSNSVEGHFYLYQGQAKNRKHKNLRGKKIQSSVSLKHAKRGREPWLLFSSLPIEHHTAKQIVSLYRTRMQIEEAFRDLKNTRNGFSLRHCRSFSQERLNIALLISAIAMFALWMVGIIAKAVGDNRLYQANTVCHRAVLSTFTIGWQSLQRRRRYTVAQFRDAMAQIQMHAATAGSVQ
jgi:hypothetical protein